MSNDKSVVEEAPFRVYRFRDKKGRPTCTLEAGKNFCEFVGNRNLKPMCFYRGINRELYRYEEYGFLHPDVDCPLWDWSEVSKYLTSGYGT